MVPAVSNDHIEAMIQRAGTVKGATQRSFSYIGSYGGFAGEAPDIVIKPFKTPEGNSVAAVKFAGPAIELSKVMKSITGNQDGVSMGEAELRAVARIFTEAADELLEDNNPEAAVASGAQGQGTC